MAGDFEKCAGNLGKLMRKRLGVFAGEVIREMTDLKRTMNS